MKPVKRKVAIFTAVLILSIGALAYFFWPRSIPDTPADIRQEVSQIVEQSPEVITLLDPLPAEELSRHGLRLIPFLVGEVNAGYAIFEEKGNGRLRLLSHETCSLPLNRKTYIWAYVNTGSEQFSYDLIFSADPKVSRVTRIINYREDSAQDMYVYDGGNLFWLEHISLETGSTTYRFYDAESNIIY